MIARGFLLTITRNFFGVMDIYVYLVDWQEVTQRHSQGTLNEDVLEALEARESWLKFLELIGRWSMSNQQAQQGILIEWK